MVNETLCKILCHNLVALIHEMCELHIELFSGPPKSCNIATVCASPKERHMSLHELSATPREIPGIPNQCFQAGRTTCY
jgi:hypothetical protein